MRSPGEIAYRLRQELNNLRLWAMPPVLARDAAPSSPLPQLPSPSRVADLLRATAFPEEIHGYARQILDHRFPLLGLTIETGPQIHWRRDYVNQRESGLRYFRLVPYLDAAQTGDHKVVWELNRHQHLVLLAQMFLFDPSSKWLDEIWRELDSWINANPFQRGINWSSALEVAFRAWSWIWIFHLAGAEMPEPLRAKFLNALHLHGLHLETNLSFYFSPNTHLLGEAVVLHALGVLFPAFPRAQKWRDLGGRVVREQLARQVRADGGHFEQSTYYHVYALDMFLFHGILAGAGDDYRAKIALMADYLDAIEGPSRNLPFLGDDDGGRFFHPSGPRRTFGRATLATCAAWLGRHEAWTCAADDFNAQAAWWLASPAFSSRGTSESRLFAETGLAVMVSGDRQIIVDAGPFGPWGSGHSHSDTLSLITRAGDQEILIDPGTYTYVGNAADRDWFRGSAAHNTIRIDRRDQATPVNPFRWTAQPSVHLRKWTTSATQDDLDAECSYAGFTHRRRIRFIKPALLLIVDEISGPAGEHEIEQFWHFGSTEAMARLTVDGPAEHVKAWRSETFAAKSTAPALRVARRTPLPTVFGAALHLSDPIAPVRIETKAGAVLFECSGRQFLLRRD